MAIADFLTNKEWYDNTKLSTILACPRKGFFASVLQGGLEAGVGPGADFGTVIHGATATYYAWWGRDSELRRRALAFRSLAALHETLFTGAARDALEYKHTIESGWVILDHYFDTHLADDSALKPIEIELAGAIEISPRDSDPPDFTQPFWYVFRIDRIVKRLMRGDNWIVELKTTGGGVDRELLKLQHSRQPRGYLYCARQFPGPAFTGILADVVGVMAKSLDSKRAFYPKPLSDSQAWRAQTIRIVQEWRHKLFLAEVGQDPLTVFYENTGECTAYGRCAFFDLCDPGGFNAFNLSKFKPNTWNPLALVDTPLPVEKTTTTIEDNQFKESIRL